MPRSLSAPGLVLWRHTIKRSLSAVTRSAADRNAIHVERPNMLGPQMVACRRRRWRECARAAVRPPAPAPPEWHNDPAAARAARSGDRSDRNSRSVRVSAAKLCSISNAPAASTNAAVISTPASHRAAFDGGAIAARSDRIPDTGLHRAPDRRQAKQQSARERRQQRDQQGRSHRLRRRQTPAHRCRSAERAAA